MYKVSYHIEAGTLKQLTAVLLSLYISHHISPEFIETDLGKLSWNQPMATMLVRGEITEKEYIRHNIVA